MLDGLIWSVACLIVWLIPSLSFCHEKARLHYILDASTHAKQYCPFPSFPVDSLTSSQLIYYLFEGTSPSSIDDHRKTSYPRTQQHMQQEWELIYYCMIYKSWLGVVHKRRPHKIAKNWPPSLCPQNIRTGSTTSPPCPCRHTINFEKSEVICTIKSGDLVWRTPLVRKISVLDNPSSLTADVLYGQPLVLCFELSEFEMQVSR